VPFNLFFGLGVMFNVSVLGNSGAKNARFFSY